MEARVLNILSQEATAGVSPDYGPVILGMGPAGRKLTGEQCSPLQEQGLGVSSDSPSSDRRGTLTLLTEPSLSPHCQRSNVANGPQTSSLTLFTGRSPMSEQKRTNRPLHRDAHMGLNPMPTALPFCPSPLFLIHPSSLTLFPQSFFLFVSPQPVSFLPCFLYFFPWQWLLLTSSTG